MKILRLIAFIPAFILTLVVCNTLITLLLYLINFFIQYPSPLSFLWDNFLKSAFVSYFGIFIGVLVYPLKNQLIPLIIFSLFYVFILIFLFLFYDKYWELISEEVSNFTIVNQISTILGVLVGVGGVWYSYIKRDI